MTANYPTEWYSRYFAFIKIIQLKHTNNKQKHQSQNVRPISISAYGMILSR